MSRTPTIATALLVSLALLAAPVLGADSGGRFHSEALQFGTPGTDLVFTADGTDVAVTGTGDLIWADSLGWHWGTGEDVLYTPDGTDLAISGSGDQVYADSFVAACGAGQVNALNEAMVRFVGSSAGDAALEIEGTYRCVTLD